MKALEAILLFGKMGFVLFLVVRAVYLHISLRFVLKTRCKAYFHEGP